MEIKIKSRKDIERIALTPFLAKTALISITDYKYKFPDLKNRPDYILQLAFDDVDNDVFEDEIGGIPTESQRIFIEEKYHMLSDGQAKQIANFYKDICANVDIIICQCEHGQSRSAAIAAAIMEYSNKNGIEIFASDNYFPYKTVFKKVLTQLKNYE